MINTTILDNIVNRKKSLSLEGLISLIEEVKAEQFTQQEKDLITPDFFENTLKEVFSGIDYSKIVRNPLNANSSLQSLLERQEKQETSEYSSEEIRLGLPKLRISEDWGKPESQDRQIIQRFTSSIPGNTLKQKLENVNNIATGQVQMASLGQILGTLVTLEVLYTILSQYTESAGGFIFEGFLAGLFGENSVQITDVGDDDAGATGKPITDVQLGDREYSLKLLGPGTAVKGSWKNMVEHFAGARDHVVYLDARRSGKAATDSLEFGEFVITLPNFMEIFYEPWKAYAQKEISVKSKEDLLSAIEEYGDLLISVQFPSAVGRVRSGKFKLKFGKPEARAAAIQKLLAAIETMPDRLKAVVAYSEEDYTKSTRATQLFGSAAQFNDVQEAIESGDKKEIILALRATDGWLKKRQFEFTRNQAESIANFQHISTLLLGEEQLKKTWMIYADILKKTITPVYLIMARFNQNVSSYFMGTDDTAARKAYALAAQQDLGALKEATDEAISQVEQSEKAEYAPEVPRTE